MDILVADDERTMRNYLKGMLEREGHAVRTATDGASAVAEHLRRRADLVLLDVMMPVMDGLSACREIRAVDRETPILILTAKDGEADEVAGLAAGADDFISKSAPERVFLARVASALRRLKSGVASAFEFSGWTVEPEKLRMASAGKTVALAVREVEMLRLFAARPEQVFSRDALLTRFWGVDFGGTDHALSMAVARLREKLGAAGDALRAVRGGGYAYFPS